MLQLFAFDRVAVAVADLYFLNPVPKNDQFGPERGVRVELRTVSATDGPSIYAAREVHVGGAIWRADLLSSVDSPVSGFDRVHHHPHFEGAEPGPRVFDPAMEADPLGWTLDRLADVEGLVAGCGFDSSVLGPGDGDALRAELGAIGAAISRMVTRIEAGELARPPAADPTAPTRAGWL